MESSIIPYGYCHCGCGQKTTIPAKSIVARGVVRGVPRKYIHNHHVVIVPVMEDAAPFKIDGEPCRFIRLTKGLIAIIDAEDYERLNRYAWQAQESSNKRKTHYAITTERRTGKRIFMHLLLAPSPEGKQTDHKNGESLDNRKSNLRPATFSQQQQNRVLTTANKSGYRGVSWFRQYRKWVSMLTHNGEKYFLGYSDVAEEAARAYDKKAKEMFGPFARLNFPNE